MKLFKSKLANRLAISKTIWLVFWWVLFFMIPSLFGEQDLFLRFGTWAWYITLGWIIWLMGIMDRHPAMNFAMPFWIRWLFIWAWMNFVLVLFVYDNMNTLMLGTAWEWLSPWWIVLEWALFWIIADYFATWAWEWKELL